MDRNKIYELLLSKAILIPEDVNFIRALHDLSYLGPITRRQGSPLSPSLFNIYIDANDTAFIIKKKDLTTFIIEMERTFALYGLTINKKRVP